MALRMARKMNDSQPSPVRQFHPGLKMFINFDGTISQDPASESFEDPANSGGATVGKRTIDVGLFSRVCEHRGSGALFDFEKVAGMIKMSVAEKNSFDVIPA